MNLRWKSLRGLNARLTLSYILLMIGAVLAFTAGSGLVLFFQMRSQLAHFAVQDIETVEGLMFFEPGGNLTVRDDYHNHPESRQILEHYLEVRSSEGALLYRNARLGSRTLGGPPLPNEGSGGYSQRPFSLSDGTRVILVSRRHTIAGKPVLIRLAHSEEPVWHTLREFLGAAALLFPLLAGAAALAGNRMSRSLLAPVQNMANHAERITSNHLHERLPLNGTGDELDHLAEVFNGTLTRLDQSFRQLRQFTSDASHELRTPLAAIRSIGEVGLNSLARDGTREDYRELVGSMLEEVNRLTRLVDELLLMSRADGGAIQLNYAPVSIFALTRDTVALLEPLAEEKEQHLVLTGDGETTIAADPLILRQALINVLHNAIKYSPRGATTLLKVRWEGGSVTVSVRDQGPGIAPEHMECIFNRFYRVDQGRSRDTGGFGLGLAITQWAVQAHGGVINVSSVLGNGSEFQIALPANRIA